MIRTEPRRAPIAPRPPLEAAALAVIGLALLVPVGMAASGVGAAAPGDLDPSFGTGGRVITDFPEISNDVAEAVIVLPDGRIVAAGRSSWGGDMDVGVAAYLSDGRLDASFGTGGFFTRDTQGDDRAFDLAVQSDGKLLVAGNVEVDDDLDFFVMRLTQDGERDSSFQDDGELAWGTTEDETATAIEVMPDDRFVVAGFGMAGGDNDILVARFLPDGALDPSFAGGDGYLYVPLLNDDRGHALALEPDGDIVVAAQVSNGTSIDFAALRITADGALDTSFGGSDTGYVLVDFSAPDASDDFALGIARQPDGRFVVAGSAKKRGVGYTEDIALARLTADGVLDTTFSGDGMVLTDFEAGEKSDMAFEVAIQANGAIVAAGVTMAQGTNDFAIAQYTAEGVLDTRFSGDGMARADFAGQDYGYAVALQPDGRLVMAGMTNYGEQNDFALARFEGSVDIAPTATGTYAPPGTATPTNTGTAVPPGTATPTATGTYVPPVTATPTDTESVATPATPTPTRYSTAPASATPTVTPDPGSCESTVDVLLIGTYENDAEQELLVAHLEAELARFELATGLTAAHALYPRAADGLPLYRDWIAALLASAFRGPDGEGRELPCASAHVVMASYDDVAALRDAWKPLDDLFTSGALARSDFLDHGIDDVLMPPYAGASPVQLALPWRRSTCSDSFQHLAVPSGAAPETNRSAAGLIAHLVGPEAQRARYDLHVADDVEQARLAYPSIAAPYTSGWPGSGEVVRGCPQARTLRAWDPALVEPMVVAANELADALAPAVNGLGASEYSRGPDRQNPVYTYGSTVGVTEAGPNDIMIVATKMFMDRPMTSEQLDARMDARGVVVGQFGSWSASRIPVVFETLPSMIFVPSLQLGVAPSGTSARFAILLREGRIVLVRPDGAEATAAEAARLIGGGVEVELLPLEDAPPALSSDIELLGGSVCICIKVDKRKVGVKIK